MGPLPLALPWSFLEAPSRTTLRDNLSGGRVGEDEGPLVPTLQGSTGMAQTARTLPPVALHPAQVGNLAS